MQPPIAPPVPPHRWPTVIVPWRRPVGCCAGWAAGPLPKQPLAASVIPIATASRMAFGLRTAPPRFPLQPRHRRVSSPLPMGESPKITDPLEALEQARRQFDEAEDFTIAVEEEFAILDP